MTRDEIIYAVCERLHGGAVCSCARACRAPCDSLVEAVDDCGHADPQAIADDVRFRAALVLIEVEEVAR